MAGIVKTESGELLTISQQAEEETPIVTAGIAVGSSLLMSIAGAGLVGIPFFSPVFGVMMLGVGIGAVMTIADYVNMAEKYEGAIDDEVPEVIESFVPATAITPARSKAIESQPKVIAAVDMAVSAAALAKELYPELAPANQKRARELVSKHGQLASLFWMCQELNISSVKEYPGLIEWVESQVIHSSTEPIAPTPGRKVEPPLAMPSAVQSGARAVPPIDKAEPPIALPGKTVLDSAADLGQNPQSAIIAGVPGAGKGIFVSNSLRELKKRNPHVKIFAIDPKDDPKETGYWSIADKLWRKDFESCPVEESAVWLMDRVAEYRSYKGAKLLVLDEGTTALTVLKLAKVFDEREMGDGKIQSFRVDLLGEFKKFLVTISGMGDSRESWIWIVCQVINCDDLGITGGVRSIFRSIALVSPKNRNAVTTFFSTGFVPLPPGGKDALYRMMENSDCNRAFYDGKTDEWVPTPIWPNHSGYNRDTRQQVEPPQNSRGQQVTQQMTIPIATPATPSPWQEEPEEAIAITQSKSAAEILAKLKVVGLTLADLEVLANANP